MLPEVSVVILTQRRPEPLVLAITSVFRQEGVRFDRVELVVVDNDATKTAETQVQALAVGAPCSVRYVHEPRPGVAHARNTAVATTAGAWIAFLDDDEEASAGWLAALIRARDEFEADVVFGPVRARIPCHLTRHRPYLYDVFSRASTASAGLIDTFYGCGNSLVRRSALPQPTPFPLSRNHTGGEDDDLFTAMKTRGARFAWSPTAWVWEDPALERLRLSYTLLRAFSHGQGPTRLAFVAEPTDWRGVGKWVAIGAAQLLIFGTLAGLQRLCASSRWPYTLDKAIQGLGKMLGWTPILLRLYGRPSERVQLQP